MNICIIGAGAAGCFCAIEMARRHPDFHIEIFEGGSRALAKVSITGGGRCNLTNTFRDIKSLQDAYPRGDKLMKRALRAFSHEDAMKWFEQEGIPLVTQDDQCVFPQSQDAMQIVGTLLQRMREEGVLLHLSHRVESVSPRDGRYEVHFLDTKLSPKLYDAVVVTIGGCPGMKQLDMLRHLDLRLEPPVPSLFTLSIKDEQLNSLMGTVVKDAALSIPGTKFRSHGPLLITHWGVSGPATLKLSSYAARHLGENGYRTDLCINWLGKRNEEEAKHLLERIAQENIHGLVANTYPTELTQNLWRTLMQRAALGAGTRWADVSGKRMNKLTSVLTSDVYHVMGKGQYKEEFVTCGGVALSNINLSTMECKTHPGLFFAGEVLDVDAITGGFNLQAAWSMAWVVANAINKPCHT